MGQLHSQMKQVVPDSWLWCCKEPQWHDFQLRLSLPALHKQSHWGSFREGHKSCCWVPWLSCSHASSNKPSWIHMAPHFSPYSLPALTLHHVLPWFDLPQFVHRLHWASLMVVLRSLLGSSTISYLMMPHLEVISATMSTVFFIAKQCGYMMSHFMTASLCNSNSIPNCHCNSKTTYIR